MPAIDYFVQTIDPVIIQIGPLVLRWYGFAYLAGFIAGSKLLKWLAKKDGLLPADFDFDSLVFYVAIGVIVGGRLGEVLFYRPGYYFSHPFEIVQIWHGGMSSHGGMIGVLVAVWLFARSSKVNPVVLLDLVCMGATPGLFFGRIANFINSELVGYPTQLPWAVIFPSVDNVPRHPVQLYQALTEGPLLLALLLMLPYPRAGIGMRIGLFVLLYALVRTVTEHFRETDAEYLGLTFGLTNGQWLSLALGLIGLISVGLALKFKQQRSRPS